MHTTGKIVSWDDEKGYGFAETDKHKTRIFVHISDFEPSTARPCIEQTISFIISEQERGKPKGTSIAYIGEKLNSQPRKSSKLPVYIVLVFFASLAWLVYSDRLPVLVIVLYATLSVVAYLLFWKDKAAAQKGEWRVSEFALLMMSLLCGWPGALIAQNRLRHKTKKISFQIPFYVLLLLNLAALSWLFTDKGTILAQSIALNVSFFIAGTGVFDIFQVWFWKLKYFFK